MLISNLLVPFSINHQLGKIMTSSITIFQFSFQHMLGQLTSIQFGTCVAKACLSKSRKVTNLIVSVWLVFCLVCFSVVSRIGCVTSMIKLSLPLPQGTFIKDVRFLGRQVRQGKSDIVHRQIVPCVQDKGRQVSPKIAKKSDILYERSLISAAF